MTRWRTRRHVSRVIRNVALLAAFMRLFSREVGRPPLNAVSSGDGAKRRLWTPLGAEGSVVRVQEHQLKYDFQQSSSTVMVVFSQPSLVAASMVTSCFLTRALLWW